mgnify:CR=1 FL=1
MKHFKVGIIGATGMVGQRFATLLEDHPWFEVCALAGQDIRRGSRDQMVHEKAHSRKVQKHDNHGRGERC